MTRVILFDPESLIFGVVFAVVFAILHILLEECIFSYNYCILIVLKIWRLSVCVKCTNTNFNILVGYGLETIGPLLRTSTVLIFCRNQKPYYFDSNRVLVMEILQYIRKPQRSVDPCILKTSIGNRFNGCNECYYSGLSQIANCRCGC